MAQKTKQGGDVPAPAAKPQQRPVPQGYRQGIVTAITVLLGFSLTFFRFWGFEASGDWTTGSIIAAGIFVLAVILQIFALYRSLQVQDDEQVEYRKTVGWFIASAVVLLIALLIAVVVYSTVSSGHA